ncbi:MAG: glycosyltransferase family 2 protein [Gorillibacterium sp.]|nr:glycosyltransferase family 2 protein [Gorillibacterium sp.]
MSIVSLCMIVRDEEEHLGECLRAASPFVDEIIIVDTGSQDQTISIAKQYGAHIFRFKWNDHFADARNFALKRASGDWILVLDADERIEPADLSSYRSLLEDNEVSGYWITIRHQRSEHPADYETDSICRLFRRLPKANYRGRVHEDISISLLTRYPHLTIKRTELVIAHYGYDRQVAETKKKAERNRKLLEQAIREESDSLYYRYALGTEAFIQESYAEVITQLTPLLVLVPPTAGYAADLAYKLSFAYWRTGQLEAARQTVEVGLLEVQLPADLLELRSLFLLEEGRAEAAYHSLIRFASAVVFSDSQQSKRHDYWLSQAHMRLGNWQQAADCLEKCLTVDILVEQALPRWLELSLLLQPLAQFAPKLKAVLVTTKPSIALTLVGRVALESRQGKEMLRLLEDVYKDDSASTDQELAFFRAAVLAQAGDANNKAAEILQQLIQLKPERHLLLFLWALLVRDSEPRELVDLLYHLGELDPELVSLAERLRGEKPTSSTDEPLLKQAAYVLLLVRAWSGFLIVWQQLAVITSAKAPDTLRIPKAWRSSLYHSPVNVREAVLGTLVETIPQEEQAIQTSSTSSDGKGLFSERLFTALLAHSLGNKAQCHLLLEELIEQFPKRLEPRIGLYQQLADSGNWSALLMLADD